MDPKSFLIRIFAFSALLIGVIVVSNYWIDLYGLFRPVKDRSISIYSDERTAKYLLAYQYVPENFEGYLLGPSLSANLDTKQIEKYRIYNLSMMGANITEQKAVVDKALEKSPPKFVILCLHPYLTLDHGMKTGMINRKEYYGALGSMSLYKAYTIKFFRDHAWLPHKYPPHQFNDYGRNEYNELLQTMPSEEKIKEQLQRDDAIKATIDPEAKKEFEALVDELVENKVKIIAYFHPLPYPLYQKFSEPLYGYEKEIRNILEGKAFVVEDFNDGSYDFFTKDFSNYIDHGHLSDKGQQYLMKEILRKAGML